MLGCLRRRGEGVARGDVCVVRVASRVCQHSSCVPVAPPSRGRAGRGGCGHSSGAWLVWCVWAGPGSPGGGASGGVQGVLTSSDGVYKCRVRGCGLRGLLLRFRHFCVALSKL